MAARNSFSLNDEKWNETNGRFIQKKKKQQQKQVNVRKRNYI